jgi:hypothetical protein
MAYMPTSLTGCFLCLLYTGMVALAIIVPQIIFPDSRIVPAYQVVTFLLFWWFALRFAKRHSA